MCQDCRIRALERKKEQFEAPREDCPLTPRTSYPSKSKKVWRDRYLAARAWRKRDIEWYQRGKEQGYTDAWFYKRLKRSDWVAKKYREARQAAKDNGAIE